MILINKIPIIKVLTKQNYEYAHAVAGFVSDHPGFSFEAGGKAYLTGETTKKGATWGTIAKEQADSSKWIPVLLP